MKKLLFSLLFVSLLTLFFIPVMVSSSGSEFQSGWQENQLIAEKVSKTLDKTFDKTFDKNIREIPTSQFYQEFVDEMGRTYSGNLILQELITENGAYKATYVGELYSN